MKVKAHPSGKRFVYLATGVSALGGLLFGYDVGVISGAILFIQKAFALTPAAEEIVVSAVLLGSLLGAVIGGTLADRLGRRNDRHGEHPAPCLETGKGVVDQIGDDDAAGERDLIDGNQLSADGDRRNFANVERCHERRDADGGTRHDPGGN